jgi:hypothetical protein
MQSDRDVLQYSCRLPCYLLPTGYGSYCTEANVVSFACCCPLLHALSADCSEEKTCRFCGTLLQDWKPHMSSGAKVAPYMRVSFNGKTHKVQVKPGEEGAKEFEQQIRRMLALPEDQEFDVIFHCRAPGTGAACSSSSSSSFSRKLVFGWNGKVG